MTIKLLLASLLALPLTAAAQGRGRPPAEDHLAVGSAFSGRGNFDSRSAVVRSAFALGSLGGYSFGASADLEHVRTWSSGYFPGEVYEAAAGLRAGSRQWSFAAGARSNSDRPYNSISETDITLDASAPLGRRGPHSFMFGLNYSSRRSFLKGIPFPYLSYSYTSETLTVFFPFSLKWRPSEGREFTASYTPPRYFSLGYSRKVSAALTLGVSGGMQLKQYLLAGRPDKDEALFLEQTHAGLRTTLAPAPGWEASLWTAWGFKGRYYTGEQYDEHHAVKSTGAGPLAGLTLKKTF